MDRELGKNKANKAIQFVESFFKKLDDQEKDILPSIFKSKYDWMATFDDTTLGIFLLTIDARKRIKEYMRKDWHPFPGFFISADKKPGDAPVAIAISGSCNFFSSNHVVHMYAFSVKPGASFTVVDHFMEIGPNVTYKVDLAFVLGIDQNEDWLSIESRLLELLKYSMRVWLGNK